MRYILMGYGINEYGIEWGYEIDADGRKTLCVTDGSDRSYDYADEREAIEECERTIAMWSAEA